MKNKINLLIIMAVLVVSMIVTATAVFADDETDYNDPITYYLPEGITTYYLGEKIPYKFKMEDAWDNYYTMPQFGLMRAKDGIIAEKHTFDTIKENDYCIYSGKFYVNPDKIKPATYLFYVAALPTEQEHGKEIAKNYPEDDLAIAFSGNVYIRRLKSPTNVTVKAGTKKVNIKFRKAGGANVYQIYRSSTKHGHYKEVATIQNTKFIDKNVSRGKRYYYKVRSVRTVYNTIKSSYSSPRRTARVK